MDALLAHVQTLMDTAVQEASLTSGTATAAMSTVTNFAKPNARGPLDEVVRYVRGNAQSVQDMRTQVNQLVTDLLALTQDCRTRLPPAGGMGRGFI